MKPPTRHAVKTILHSAGEKPFRPPTFQESSTSACSLIRKFQKAPRSEGFIYVHLFS